VPRGYKGQGPFFQKGAEHFCRKNISTTREKTFIFLKNFSWRLGSARKIQWLQKDCLAGLRGLHHQGVLYTRTFTFTCCYQIVPVHLSYYIGLHRTRPVSDGGWYPSSSTDGRTSPHPGVSASDELPNRQHLLGHQSTWQQPAESDWQQWPRCTRIRW